MIGRLLLLGLGAYAANKAYKQYRMNNPAMGQAASGGEPASSDEAMGTVLDTDTLHRDGRAAADTGVDSPFGRSADSIPSLQERGSAPLQ